jgi:peptidoglycan L-alanyl-D-glutamate endopeptidase CwlK
MICKYIKKIFNIQKTPKKHSKEEISMSYSYSAKSKAKLETCHPDIQKVFNEVIKHVDCSILQGVRTVEEQEELVRTGKSQTMNSKHLKQADGYSHAIDVVPYPIDWSNRERFILFAGKVLGIAKAMSVDLVSGIDWNDDGNIKDHSFFDAPHFELKDKK